MLTWFFCFCFFVFFFVIVLFFSMIPSGYHGRKSEGSPWFLCPLNVGPNAITQLSVYITKVVGLV
jgi:hypothetical protein